MIIGAVIRSVALICFVPDFDAAVFKQLLYYFHVLAKMHAHVIICHGKSQQELCAPCIYPWKNSCDYYCCYVSLMFDLLHQLQQCVTFRIDDDLIHLEVHSCICDDKLDIESLKVELACLYYLQLPKEKISKGRDFQAILNLCFSTSQQCLSLEINSKNIAWCTYLSDLLCCVLIIVRHAWYPKVISKEMSYRCPGRDG